MQATTSKTTSKTGKAAKTTRKGGFWKPFLDGTIYDTLFYKAADEAQLKKLYKETNDFHELKQGDTKTKRLEAYADILKSEEAWAEQNDKMDNYFDDAIEMFPYERRNLGGEGAAGLKNSRIINPENFFKITIETIERRFPGGTDGTIGDQDMRDLTSALRVIYKADLWTLIKKRRLSAFRSLLWLVLVTLLTLAGLTFGADILPDANTPFGPVKGALLLFGGLAAIFSPICLLMLRDDLRQIKITYESALKASASNLRGPLHARLTETVSLIPQIMSRIDREKMDLLSQDRLKEWPVVVTRWSKLAFWLSARVEALEDFIQVQMWLIRRTHFGLRHLAGLISFGMFCAFVVAMAVIALVGGFAIAHEGAQPLAYAIFYGVALSNLFYGIMAVLNGQNYNLPQVELSEILQMHTIMGHNDTKLHDEIADLIKREKLSILHDEEMSRGPKPR